MTALARMLSSPGGDETPESGTDAFPDMPTYGPVQEYGGRGGRGRLSHVGASVAIKGE